MNGEDGELRILLLGSPQVEGLAKDVVFPTKGLELIALLACAPGHRMTRKDAAAMLWEGKTEPQALTNFRQLIARMRKLLPDFDAFFVVSDIDLTLGEGRQQVDLCLFSDLCRSDNLDEMQAAVALFRGEMLAGVNNTSDGFSHWLSVERSYLRKSFFDVAARTMISLTRFGRAPKEELDFLARRLLSIEPEREASYRSLIEAYGRNGMVDEAETLYNDLREMLKREYDEPPSPETRAIVRKVFANKSTTEPTQLDHPNKLPRIAFLAPQSPGGKGVSGLLKALIEDVTNELTRYRSFVALAPHSSFQVDHDSGMPLDNTKLKADYTVSGFIKPDGGRNTLSLRMSSCNSGNIIWAGEFSFDEEDLIKSFRMLSVRVATSLASEIERALVQEMREGGNVGAYYHYLLGQEHMAICDLPHVRKARKAFACAISEDGDFASAHARFAQTLYLEWLMRGADIPEIVVAAQNSARLACDLDPMGSLGHWIGAAIALYQRAFDESAEKFVLAEDLNPNSADLLVEHAHALSLMGDNDTGGEKFQQAIDLNPLPPDHYWWAGASIEFNAGNMDGAIELCGRLENQETVLRLLAASYALAGRVDEAKECGQQLREIYPGQTAADMVSISPDRDPEVSKRFIEGLQIAGIN